MKTTSVRVKTEGRRTMRVELHIGEVGLGIVAKRISQLKGSHAVIAGGMGCVMDRVTSLRKQLGRRGVETRMRKPVKDAPVRFRVGGVSDVMVADGLLAIQQMAKKPFDYLHVCCSEIDQYKFPPFDRVLALHLVKRGIILYGKRMLASVILDGCAGLQPEMFYYPRTELSVNEVVGSCEICENCPCMAKPAFETDEETLCAEIPVFMFADEGNTCRHTLCGFKMRDGEGGWKIVAQRGRCPYYAEHMVHGINGCNLDKG